MKSILSDFKSATSTDSATVALLVLAPLGMQGGGKIVVRDEIRPEESLGQKKILAITQGLRCLIASTAF